ncbi:hypothetical protein KJ693_11560 [bacterium]|nr:hypothetical protein [bacterium]
MTSINLSEEVIPLVRSGLLIEENILSLSLKKYQKELENFEKKHQMSTDEFTERFNAGKLGDDGVWFDWLFACKAVGHISGKLRLLKGIAI